MYVKEPGEVPEGDPVLVLAPTGMAAYHIKGNTVHSGLHIPINTDELTPLSYSD